MKAALWLTASSILMLAACGGSDPTDVTTALTTVPTASTTTTTGPGNSVETTEPSTPATEYPQLLPEFGLPLIAQTTAVSGGGPRPVLAWDAVEGADRYVVAVSAPDGRLYWAWTTADTSVPVGGLPRLEEDAFGPAVSNGMNWSVLALDESGAVVATSAIRPIDP